MNKRKWIVAGVTVLAVLNLIVLFVWPEQFAKILGLSKEEDFVVSEEDSRGSGDAALTVPEEKLLFNGKGIFDPMTGVIAADTDGSDLTEKVSISYSSGKTIDEKEIHYQVYDSTGKRMEAVRELKLDNYRGPSVKLGTVERVSWEELPYLPEVLIKDGILSADDGFGRDMSKGIAYSYEILYESSQAELTFSLNNDFQDFSSQKCLVLVDDLPDDYMAEME